MLPARTCVGGLVDAISGSKIRSPQPLAATRINDFRIGGSDGQSTNGTGRLTVKDRLPSVTVVRGFPDAAVYCCHVEDIGFMGNAADRNCTAGTERTDHAPAQVRIETRRKLLGDGKHSADEQKRETQPEKNRGVPFQRAPPEDIPDYSRR